MGNSLEVVENSAFEGCNKLNKVIVPDIASWCEVSFGNPQSNPMYYCHNLFSDEDEEVSYLIVPSSVKKITNYAFYTCNSIKALTIGNSVDSIGTMAFLNNSRIFSMYIPNSVSYFGPWAFEQCDSIMYITSDMTNPCPLPANTFSSKVYNTALLLVPKGKVQVYRDTDYWSKFLYIEEDPMSTNIMDIKDGNNIKLEGDNVVVGNISVGTQVSVYNIEGRLLLSITAPENVTKIQLPHINDKIVIVKIGNKSIKIVR